MAMKIKETCRSESINKRGHYDQLNNSNKKKEEKNEKKKKNRKKFKEN